MRFVNITPAVFVSLLVACSGSTDDTAIGEGRDAGSTELDAAADAAPDAVPNSVYTTKGLNTTMWSHVPGYQVHVDCDGDGHSDLGSNGSQAGTGSQHCELGGYFVIDKTVGFSVTDTNNNVVFQKQQRVNTLTGQMETGSQDQMYAPLNTPFAIGGAYSIAYGMYHAPGISAGDPTTTQDQAWITLTPDEESWMGTIAKVSGYGTRPFNSFILAGSHDSGMYTSKYYAIIPPVQNLSLTQKESITAQLQQGIRFFDFRPGYRLVVSPSNVPTILKDVISSGTSSALNGASLDTSYISHEHALIDGVTYDSFLDQVLGFLQTHPSEIVVVNTKYSGFVRSDMIPAQQVLDQRVQAALVRTPVRGLNVSKTLADASKTYNALISSGIRLIVSPNEIARGIDTYENGDMTKVLSEVQGGVAQCKSGALTTANPNLVLQLQGTPTNTTSVVVASIASTSFDDSHLVGSKPYLDALTHPWLLANFKGCAPPGLTVLLDDFVNSSTVDLAITLMLAK